MSAPPLIHEAGGGGSVGWINPDLLEEECEDSHCALCLGVMVKAVIGCPEGHTFCRVCLSKALVHDDRCPTCRWAPVQKESLVANRTADNLIAKLAIRCEHAPKENPVGVGPLTAKRAKVAPKTMKALRDALVNRGLDSNGDKNDLVARLEEDCKQVCTWTGSCGQFAGHRAECVRVTVKCPYKGCMASPLRTGLAKHQSTCGSHHFQCICGENIPRRLLAEHEALCPKVEIECPNEGCMNEHPRVIMYLHREDCEYEEVTCLSPGCDARLLRKDLDTHVRDCHLQEPEVQLQDLWRENARLAALSESELRHAAGSSTSRVFNWRADGWGTGRSEESEEHTFGGGFTGKCSFFYPPSHISEPCFIEFNFINSPACRVHAKFFILDKHDQTLREFEGGSGQAEWCQPGVAAQAHFTPTDEEKAQSMRADGSVRLRAVVKIFMD